MAFTSTRPRNHLNGSKGLIQSPLKPHVRQVRPTGQLGHIVPMMVLMWIQEDVLNPLTLTRFQPLMGPEDFQASQLHEATQVD